MHCLYSYIQTVITYMFTYTHLAYMHPCYIYLHLFHNIHKCIQISIYIFCKTKRNDQMKIRMTKEDFSVILINNTEISVTFIFHDLCSLIINEEDNFLLYSMQLANFSFNKIPDY